MVERFSAHFNENCSEADSGAVGQQREIQNRASLLVQHRKTVLSFKESPREPLGRRPREIYASESTEMAKKVFLGLRDPASGLRAISRNLGQTFLAISVHILPT